MVDGQRGFAIPDDRRLALVGDADAGDVEPRQVGFGDGLGRHGRLGVPDFRSVVFDPPRPGEELFERLLRRGDHFALVVDDDGSRGRGALIQCEDVFPGDVHIRSY